jgi:hypothetical protein
VVEHEGDGGGGSQSTYESFNGSDVNVNVSDLTSYYFEMMDVYSAAGQPVADAMSLMPEMVRQGLLLPVDDGIGVFPEATYAANHLRGVHSDFQHFLTDVLEGIRNIGAAATVVAEIYENGDSENAAGLDDIAFAFSEPGATGPSWFRDVESYSEAEQRLAEQTGANSMAAMGDDSMASQVIYPASGVTIYYFPDGSSKTVVSTQTTSQSQYQSGSTITETTIMGPGGVVLSSTREQSYTAAGGYKVSNVTTSTGDDRNGSTSSSETVENPDGSIQVTNETTTRTDGESKTTTSDPVTVDPGDHREDEGESGPVEQAAEGLDTYGDDEFVGYAGRGY